MSRNRRNSRRTAIAKFLLDLDTPGVMGCSFSWAGFRTTIRTFVNRVLALTVTQEQLFDRVGMWNSGFDDMRKIVASRARGYALVRGELENVDPLNAAASAWSPGGFYSTVHDITLWSETLAHGKLLNADSTARMFAIYPETELKRMHYGYAVVLANRFGHALQYHAGGIKGFNSVLQRYPDANLVIVVFSNLDSDSSPERMTSWSLGDGLAQIWFSAQH